MTTPDFLSLFSTVPGRRPSISETVLAPDSCIQDLKSQTEAWAAISDDALIGKVKRDKFIANFGGQPLKIGHIEDETKLQKMIRLKRESIQRRKSGHTIQQ